MESHTQQHEVCAPCGKQFEDWQAYIRHMITSGNHPHACAVCGQEFLSDEGKNKHQRQAHPPDQNLTCSGCHREFTRCGSLVQHVEIDGCPVFQKQALERIRDANDDYYKKMGAKKRTTATTTGVVDKAHTAIAGRVPPEVPKASPAPVGPIKSEVKTTSQAPPSRLPPRDILTDFESARKEQEYEEFKKTFPALKIQKDGRGSTDNVAIFKQSMDIDSPMKGKAEVDLIQMSPNAKVPKHTSTGLTGLQQFNIIAGGAENSSMRKENVPLGKEAPEIFPPLARSLKYLGPVPQQLAAHGSESAPEEPAPKYYNKYDPDQPGFSLEQYRNPYSKKYRCAFLGCTKLLNSAEGLYMHLKSNAHLTDLYSCPFCFNKFHSAAAITQHLESQTNRCNARDDRRFNQLIDQVAGGMIDAAGTHDDNTHRYYSAQIVPKLQLDTVHEANEEVIVNAVHDPEYRSARLREREQKIKEDRARIEAWQNDDWAE